MGKPGRGKLRTGTQPSLRSLVRLRGTRRRLHRLRRRRRRRSKSATPANCRDVPCNCRKKNEGRERLVSTHARPKPAPERLAARNHGDRLRLPCRLRAGSAARILAKGKRSGRSFLASDSAYTARLEGPRWKRMEKMQVQVLALCDRCAARLLFCPPPPPRPETRSRLLGGVSSGTGYRLPLTPI